MGYRTPADVQDEFSAHPRRALILTTVVHESRAVQAHLASREFLTNKKGSFYEYGRFADPAGDWLIVHAPCGYGNSDAGLMVSDAHHEFGKFDAMMFVGVAGSLKEDIPVGSVVASDFVFNTQSAKVEDKVTLGRPNGHAAAFELVSAARALVFEGSWPALIRDPAGMTLPPRNDYKCPWPPAAEIKGIASGEEVLASTIAARAIYLREHFNSCGAVEMEGWGAMNAAHQENTPAIIIRGISDMCAGKDHTKDQAHQPIASAHASAFAFGILSFRSRASEGGASEASPAAEAPKDEAPAPDERVEIVLNFKGRPEDWTEEKLGSVVERLKESLGDPDLELVRVEAGSVRLVLRLRADAEKIDWTKVREATASAGASFVGVGTVGQAKEATAAKAALRAASANLLAWERTLPNGDWIERPEISSIKTRFLMSSSSAVLLGEPGSGKSALLSQIAGDLIEEGATVFALKADLVSPEIRSEEDLQRHLGLPGLPSDLILQLAVFQPVYVLVDQLDALASQLDLKTDRLNIFLNLVRKVGSHNNVHLLLSARTFEFNHDVRLRSIEAEAEDLALPPWHEVQERLAAAGVDAEGWPETARELVRVPQHLKTFLALSSNAQPFTKYQAMLEQLWRERVGADPQAQALDALASDIASQMAEEEALWLAAARFDDRPDVLGRLEALKFVVRSENGLSIGFSHQTIFDYVLARTFVRTAGLLSEYVLERQASLFARPKLWSALNYLRGADLPSYEREFLAIWRDVTLRQHLRILLIEFLGQVAEPMQFEKLLMVEITASPDLRIYGLKALGDDWFSSVASTTVREAMHGTEAERLQALRLLIAGWKIDAERVIALVRERWLTNADKYDTYTWRLVRECPLWTEDVEGLAHTVLARTPITNWEVDYVAQTVGVEQLDVAFRLVRAKLDYLLARAREAPPPPPYPHEGTADEKTTWHIKHDPEKPFDSIAEAMEWTALPDLAALSPSGFLDQLWPWYVAFFSEVIARSTVAADDYVFPGRWKAELDFDPPRERSGSREKPLLSALELAVDELAAETSDAFAEWAKATSEIAILPAQQLVARGYGLAASTLASEALVWLLADERRFQLGNRHGERKTTCGLIRACSPHWTDDEVALFERKVLAYKPKRPAHLTEPRQKATFTKLIRAARKELLAAVPQGRLSQASQDLVVTEQRALGNRFERAMGEVEGGWVGSPMTVDAMKKAKDRDILRIFHEIPDRTDWDHPKSWMLGGNIQLSREFAEFARTDTDRGFRIMEQFEKGLHERAAGYALDAMASDKENAERILEAVLDLHERGFDSGEFKESTARAIEKVADAKFVVPAELIALLEGWLVPSDAPDLGSDDEKEEREETTLKDESIIWGHGSASFLPSGNFTVLSALASILLNRKEEGRDHLIAILSEHLEREHNPKIWQSFLYRLSNAGGSTPEGVSAFIRAVAQKFPAIFATREGVVFLAYAQRWDDQLVYELTEEWAGDDSFRARAYGELVGLVAIGKGGEQWLIRQASIINSDNLESRTGLAYALANLWPDPRFHETAGAVLPQLRPEGQEPLVGAVLDVFRVVDELVPDGPTIELLKMLADDETNLAGAPSHFIVERLQTLLPFSAELVAKVALKLVDAWRSELGDMRTGTVTAAPQLTDLAITLHRLGGQSRQDGVTIFEAMIEIDAYGARSTLAEIDGRFDQKPKLRARIPRGRARRRRLA
jgi:nucleoside phosphorylase